VAFWRPPRRRGRRPRVDPRPLRASLQAVGDGTGFFCGLRTVRTRSAAFLERFGGVLAPAAAAVPGARRLCVAPL